MSQPQNSVMTDQLARLYFTKSPSISFWKHICCLDSTHDYFDDST